MGTYSFRYAGLVAAILATGCGWTPRQAATAQASSTLLVADWVQTRGITRSCLELNPILGECGQRFPVDVYFPLTIGASLLVGHLLPAWREVLFAGIAGAEGAVVYLNTQVE